VERRANEFPVGLVKVTVGFPESLEGRQATQFHDQVFLRLGDHHRPTDRAAALGHDRADPDPAADRHAHRPGVVGAGRDRQRVASRRVTTTGLAAHDRHARMFLLHPFDEGIDGKGKRIGQQQERRILRPRTEERFRPARKHPAVGRL
jgi:hypothetical protein